MPKRKPEHMSKQRERIVRATIECIADKGIERSSIGDIARRAALSVGAIYVHFEGKDEIVAEALRYGTMGAQDLPDGWEAFKAMITSLEPQKGFDIKTIIRNRLNLHAESVRPGPLHDVYRPLLEESIAVLAAHLERMEKGGGVRLRMTSEQTARGISAYLDGMLWFALADDRPLDEVRSELYDGLDCFVDRPND
jgi:AcrR family transcriptional regulator